jgi:hypothetical protein
MGVRYERAAREWPKYDTVVLSNGVILGMIFAELER